MRALFSLLVIGLFLDPIQAGAADNGGRVHPSWQPVMQVLEVCRRVYSSEAWGKYERDSEFDALQTTADWQGFFKKKEAAATVELKLPRSLRAEVQPHCQMYEHGRSDAVNWLLAAIDKKDASSIPTWPEGNAKDPLVAVCRQLFSSAVAQAIDGSSLISKMTSSDVANLSRGRLATILNEREIPILLLDQFETYCFDYSYGAVDALRWSLQKMDVNKSR